MTSHHYSYPKVVATRPGPSAYERRTAVHKTVRADEQPPAQRDPEPRKRRPAR